MPKCSRTHQKAEQRDFRHAVLSKPYKPVLCAATLPEVKCFNPSFDVTDHELLTGIVTEKGICYPPFTESLAALFKDKE